MRSVVVIVLALAIVAVAAYATWPGRASPGHTDRSSVSTCDYASGDWMQQPGCERPPPR
ncbi:MAG TPA: hypothetical protein VFK76_04035 [Gaiellaceae bacterium]|nr:hypothetical protein [Gaiellaceae bacterium]